MKLKKNLNKFKDLFYRLRNILIVSCSNRHLTAGLIYIDFAYMCSLLCFDWLVITGVAEQKFDR